MLEASKQVLLDQLIDAYCEERLDASQMERLEGLLINDPAAQSYYLARVDLHNSLRWRINSETTRRALGELKKAGVGVPPSDQRKREVVSLRWWPWAAAAAIALFVFLSQWRNSDRGKETIPPVARSGHPVDNEQKTAVEDSLAEIIESRGAVWAKKPDGPLSAGKFHLQAGMARLRFKNGSTVSLRGPASFELRDSDSFYLHEGTLTAFVPPQAQGFAVSTPSVRVTEAGTEYGLHRGANITKLAVFRGEIEAEVDSDYLGLKQTFRLTRNDGMAVDHYGAVTTSIIGDHHCFAGLRQAPDLHIPQVANGSFEYPKTDRFTSMAPAGWELLAHPVANADLMDVSAGTILAGENGEGVPAAPLGRQWAYLNARTFADGRSVYTSMHQSVGLVVAGVTYELKAMVGRQKGLAECEYEIGLYAGSRSDGPVSRLQVWRSPALPPAGKALPVCLTYHSPLHTPYRDDELFIVIRAIPGDKPGVRRILIDDVRLSILRP
ncbi:MAG: hypothetical protein KatS3mg105_0780 [Gemmatales bacterium]|nr:MAG: hypothetical protein KatS3mg105_0780 [Gemmatales bacterium]